MTTIALVDDDRNILTSLSTVLQLEGYQIQTYSDGAAALGGLQQSPPDAAIFDIKMPSMDGLDLLCRLRQVSNVPVILLTSKNDEDDELSGFKLGADDFIHKPFSQRLILERVKAVLRRTRTRPRCAPAPSDSEMPVIEKGGLQIDAERYACTWKQRPVTLTVTEFLILQTLALRPGTIKSREAIKHAIHEDQVYVDDRSIDSHIKRIRKKFKDVDSGFDQLETLYGVGYRFKPN